jgi:DNA-binding FadR family transcriptional regulator
MGIITIVPKKGVFLKDKRKLEIPVTSDITYTMSQIKDVLELRNTILKASINKCIKDEQPFDRIGLKELLKKIRESSEKKIPENEYRFQSLLVSPCKNNFYISMFRKMRNTFFACQYFLTDKTTLKQQIHLGYTTLLENLTAEPIQQISLTLDHILNIYVDNILLIEEKPINPIWRYLEDE